MKPLGRARILKFYADRSSSRVFESEASNSRPPALAVSLLNSLNKSVIMKQNLGQSLNKSAGQSVTCEHKDFLVQVSGSGQCNIVRKEILFDNAPLIDFLSKLRDFEEASRESRLQVH